MKCAIIALICVLFLNASDQIEELELLCVYENELSPIDTSPAVDEVFIPVEPDLRFTEEDEKREVTENKKILLRREVRKAHGLRAGGISLVSTGSTILVFTVPVIAQGVEMVMSDTESAVYLQGVTALSVSVPLAIGASALVTGGVFMIVGGNRRQREAEKRFTLVPEVNPFENRFGFTATVSF